MRRFAVIGQRASASPDFSLVDIPGTSGRLDVLLRCLRAGLLISHELRRDTVVYLVLLGGTPTTLRFDGSAAKFIRPDERQLAILVKRVLSSDSTETTFVPVREGIAIARAGIEVVLADAPCARYLLDERGQDVRSLPLPADALFFVGDHQGFAAGFDGDGALAIALGPVSVQADDAIALIHNELDRR